MKTSLKDQIISDIEKYITKTENIVVWVSGWPDSMYLITILKELYSRKWRKQDSIHIAHFNHWQRKKSIEEQNFLKKYFSYNTFYRNTIVPKKWLSETKLRQERHLFFDEVCKMAWSKSLFLWHNLTDRIESTLMNMVRWAWKDWLLSIKKTQDKRKYIIYRPLLDIDKVTIQKQCDINKIDYFIDATNKKNITQRNILRNTIVPEIQKLHSWWEYNRYESWKSFYNLLENTWNKQNTIPWEIHQPHPLRWATHRYSSHISQVSDDDIVALFRWKHYITKKTIWVIRDFIDHRSWYLYIGWIYIFIIWDELHCIDGKKDFWKWKQPWTKKLLTHWKLEYNWYTYTIKKTRVWWTIRYPQEWDIYKKKRLLKILLNRKIPIFMRKFTPIIVKDWKIIDILYK